MPITDYNYTDIEPTGFANPENMFIAVAVIIAIAFFFFGLWTLYNWLN